MRELKNIIERALIESAGASIQYALPHPSPVVLKIDRISGQVVRLLVESWQGAGRHRVTWDGKDESGRPAASGLYLYRLESAGGIETQTMILVR